MSAFVVSKAHVDAMVAAGLAPCRMSWYHDGERHELTHTNADEVGAMLWAENIESVSFRYSPPGREQIYGEGFGEDSDMLELPGTYREESPTDGVAAMTFPEWATEYTFPLGRVKVREPVEILRAIDCYEYQSCEHDGWDESEAHAFCEGLRSRMIHLLPGYDEAAWEIKG